MEIVIAAAADKRRRYRFVVAPLETSGHVVKLLTTRPVVPYLSAIAKVALRRRKPHLIIAMGIGPKELVAFCVARLRQIPIAVRLGGDPLRDRSASARSAYRKRQYSSWVVHSVNRLLAQAFLTRFDALFVVSDALAHRLSSQGKRAVTTCVVPQYCEGEPVEHDYDIEGPLELLTVANLRYSAKAHGVIWLIKQLIDFANTFELEIRFIVAGGGTYLRDIRDYLSAVSLPKKLRINLDGFLENLEPRYLKADVFLYHSDHDALPNVILESKRYGLPILANDCSEFRAIVRDNVSGTLYKDGIEFQHALYRLANDKSWRAVLGVAAAREHKEEYSVKASKKHLENAIARVLSGAGNVTSLRRSRSREC